MAPKPTAKYSADPATCERMASRTEREGGRRAGREGRRARTDETATPDGGEEEVGGGAWTPTTRTNCHHAGPWKRTDAGGGGGGSGRERPRRDAGRPGDSGSDVVCPESRPDEKGLGEEWVQSNNSQQSRSPWRLEAAQRLGFEKGAPAERRRGVTRRDACDEDEVERRR